MLDVDIGFFSDEGQEILRANKFDGMIHGKYTFHFDAMKVVYQGKEIGIIDNATFGITRAMAPLYVMGRPNPHTRPGARQLEVIGDMGDFASRKIPFKDSVSIVFEKVVSGELYQILLDQSEPISITNTESPDVSKVRFVCGKASIHKHIVSNEALVKKLLKKEWSPSLPIV